MDVADMVIKRTQITITNGLSWHILNMFAYRTLPVSNNTDGTPKQS
jgi:hypothetical protein